MGHEQLLAMEGDVVGDTDVADMTAGPSGLDGLQHRFLGADRFDDRVCPQAVGELFDAFYPGIAALGDDVGGSEFAGQSLAGILGTPRHESLRPPPACRPYTAPDHPALA